MIKLSYCQNWLNHKPTGDTVALISSSLGRHVKEIDPSSNELREVIDDISMKGSSFCPATFKDGKRRKECFEQQQFFALDFDNKSPDRKVTLSDIKSRADKYEVPFLFAYETLSSKQEDKFRVVFLNDAAITDGKVAEAMQLALGKIFPEADPSCYKDVSRMYFGGKKQLYYDDRIPTINIESVFRNMARYFSEKHGHTHYKNRLKEFSRETGIALTQKGLLDVKVSTDKTETSGVSVDRKDGKNSPDPIIYENNINVNGEILPKRYYHIKLTDDTSDPSVTTEVAKTSVVDKKVNHNLYRSGVLSSISEKCKLFQVFMSGERDPVHEELFGLATNLINVETGSKVFQAIQSRYPDLYDEERKKKWSSHLSYMSRGEYKPMDCDSFCPYRDSCKHGKNILSTVSLKRGTMERLPGYHEEFVSLKEMQDATFTAIKHAFLSQDSNIHVIRAMTGAGKTYSYLRLMEENPDSRFLIAAPTNLLKNEIYEKAKENGIIVLMTPSLEEIKDDIPEYVWRKIQELYRCGRYKEVHPYIRKVLKEERIEALVRYMKERDAAYKAQGNIITTHRYMLNMDEDKLSQFDAIIIDEDIIFKSIISNQAEIKERELDKLLFYAWDGSELSEKISALEKEAKKSSCIELDGFEYETKKDSDPLVKGIDIPAFCQAEHFILRKASEDKTIKEDTYTFIKPASFQDIKYIVVSATASKDIYEMYFGEDRVEFVECPKAKYQGTLYQYPARSMSRRYEKEHPGSIQKIVDAFGYDDSHVITYMNRHMGELHFGNTEGSNSLEGEDILVIGTPNQVTFMYKLVALVLGVDFDEDEEMSPQLVEYKGFHFWIMTFENEDLQSIHFWMLESELEQAVGRARLLRNSCEVHLFSNFPVSQAKIVENFEYD